MSEAWASAGQQSAIGHENALPSSSSGRIASVDVLRGLTIFLMVFVNDLGKEAPSWLHHIQPPNADGMTLADLVFPMFLFILGVSIPLALERGTAAGKSKLIQLGHILTRTAGLLFMGVIYINQDADIDTWLGKPLWGLLALTSLILAWCVVPAKRGWRQHVMLALKLLGIAGIIFLLVIFRREPVTTRIPFWGPVQQYAWLLPGWWEILGLIGWAYLMGSVITLILGRRREWLMGALAVLILLHLAINHGGLVTRAFDKHWLGRGTIAYDGIASLVEALGQFNIDLRDALGSLAAITVAGCLLGSILRRDSEVSSPRARLAWARTFIVGLLIAGFVTDTFEGINKIAATPTWCLWSAAIATAIWMLLYAIMDVAGWRGWSILFRPAGANPLVAYFLHPIVLWVLYLAGRSSGELSRLSREVLSYKDSSDQLVVVGGSLGMALFVCIAAGVLGRLGLRMRL